MFSKSWAALESFSAIAAITHKFYTTAYALPLVSFHMFLISSKSFIDRNLDFVLNYEKFIGRTLNWKWRSFYSRPIFTNNSQKNWIWGQITNFGSFRVIFRRSKVGKLDIKMMLLTSAFHRRSSLEVTTGHLRSQISNKGQTSSKENKTILFSLLFFDETSGYMARF